MSIFEQKYTNYRVMYTDDCSTDGTAEKVRELIREHNQEERCTLIVNNKNKGALYNLYTMIHSCPDTTIIVLVDGDDFLVHPYVLKAVENAYLSKDKEIWLTYGQFITAPYGDSRLGQIGFCEPMPEEVIKNNSFRYHKELPSHLRTFKAALFKAIKQEDLLYEGSFFSMTWDMAIMFPMIEMAGERHYCFREPLYAYNSANPLSDWRKDELLQLKLNNFIRNKERYTRLDQLPEAPITNNNS